MKPTPETTAEQARALLGRRVAVTTTLESEPTPITGRLGHVHETAYLGLLDTDDGRHLVRIQLKNITGIGLA